MHERVNQPPLCRGIYEMNHVKSLIIQSVLSKAKEDGVVWRF